MPDTQAPAVPDSVTDLVDVLRTALVVSARDDVWIKQARKITIQYELLHEDEVYPYYTWLDGADWAFEPGYLPADDCDIVLRAADDILGEILSGAIDGREAITSGRMFLTKAPPMPLLMVMRGIFMRYAKAQARGTVPTAWAAVRWDQAPTCEEEPPTCQDETTTP